MAPHKNQKPRVTVIPDESIGRQLFRYPQDRRGLLEKAGPTPSDSCIRSQMKAIRAVLAEADAFTLGRYGNLTGFKWLRKGRGVTSSAF